MPRIACKMYDDWQAEAREAAYQAAADDLAGTWAATSAARPLRRTEESMTYWRTHFDGSYAWHYRIHIGKFIEVGFHLYKHTYYLTPDRWVFQPYAVFDRLHGE